jgi:hypothetical protein
MDTSVDFMPTQDEFKLIVNKIENCTHVKRVSTLTNRPIHKPSGVLRYDYHESETKKRKKIFLETKNTDHMCDTYDEYGRNISKQERRQELVPWVKVTYRKGKLYIPVDKKNALKSLRLL